MDFCTILFTNQLKRRKSSRPRVHRVARSVPEKAAVVCCDSRVLTTAAASASRSVQSSGTRAAGSPLCSGSRRSVPKVQEDAGVREAVM